MKLKKEGAPMSKYEEVLKKYDCDLDDQKVAEAEASKIKNTLTAQK